MRPLLRYVFIASAALLTGCAGSDPRARNDLAEFGFDIVETGTFCCREGRAVSNPVGVVKITNTDPTVAADLTVTSTDRLDVVVDRPVDSEGTVNLGPGDTLCLTLSMTACVADQFVRVRLGPGTAFYNKGIALKTAGGGTGDLPDSLIFAVDVAPDAAVRARFADAAESPPTFLQQDPPEVPILVAGQEGFQVAGGILGGIFDLGGFTVQQSNSRRFGALDMNHPVGGWGIFDFGQSDSIFSPLTDAGFSNAVQFVTLEGVTDAFYYSHDPDSGETQDRSQILLTDGGNLSHFGYDEIQGGYVRSRLVNRTNAGIGASIFSAIARSADGVKLLITSPQDERGRLYGHIGGPNDPATHLGEVGNQPRRGRSLGRVAVVSNSADGTLSSIRWDLDGTAEIVATISVGQTPIGIGLRRLAQGIGVVSTDLDGDTVWVTVLDADTAQLVSNRSTTVPPTVRGLSSAAWLSDTHVVVAGNTTRNLIVFTVAHLLEPDE